MARGKKKRHAGAARARTPARPKGRAREEPKRAAPTTERGLPRGLLLVVAGLLLITAVVTFVALSGGSDAEQEAAAPTELAAPWINPDGSLGGR